MKNKIIILGITSDIGKELAKMFYEEDYEIIGTYNSSKNLGLLPKKNIKLLKIDMDNIQAKDILKLKKISKNWKIFISCVGTISPIGKFFDNEIKKIKKGFNINFFSNLEILKKIIPHRSKKSHLFFFSGSGSNGPSNELSVYCLSKLLLIKSAELISSEYPDLNCTTIGPGFINTKIHNDLISKKTKFKKAYNKYLHLKNKETDSNNAYKNIYFLIKQCIKYPLISKGRNFSSRYDNLNEIFNRLQKKTKKNNDLFKLRRHNG